MPPTMRRPALLAASTFARFTGLIRESRCFVSSWVCHRTLFGVSSIRSENAVLRTGGGGRRHQVQAALALFESFPWATMRALECQRATGPSAIRPAGTDKAERTATMKRRGRD